MWIMPWSLSRKKGLVRQPLSLRACEAILFVGIFGQNPSLFETVSKIMERKFGPICGRSELFNFTHTDYYTEEMGADLKKKFYVFSRPIHLENLAAIKLYTGKLEARFSLKGRECGRRNTQGGRRRQVNLDPGYLSLNKVVLASTKDYSHRLYLGKGIYGEVTLFYKDKIFNPFPWTYPDYQTPGYIIFFTQMRKICYNRNK